jgi:phosphoglycerate kinase
MNDLVYRKEDLKGKKVLLRVDFNVEIENGVVTSPFRLKRTIPTIRELLLAGAQIILIAHIDDKEGGSLEPVARYLVKDFPKLFFITDIYSAETRDRVIRMQDGDVILFENLRKWPGEKANDEAFAKHLASFADVYVDEAFSVAHRAHASVVGIPKILPSYIGPAFESEVRHISKVFTPEHPFLVIIGGAKFETKVPLLDKFLKVADKVFVGGALMNDFYKAKGYFVGDSLVSKEADPADLKRMLGSDKLVLSQDVLVTFKGESATKSASAVGIGDRIMDIGEQGIETLRELVKDAKLIVWNGPLGKNEGGYNKGSEALALAIGESDATSIVGGGDVTSVIDKLQMEDKFTFVSAGGGAMLEFLSSETLVGLDAIKEAHDRMPKPVVKKGLWEKIKGMF